MFKNIPILDIAGSGGQFSADFLVRFVKSEAGSSHYDVKAIAGTQTVSKSIQNILFENIVLKSTVRNLWHSHKYNQEYTGLLLGTYTEEEFVGIARQYAKSFSQIDSNQIEQASVVILETLGHTASSDELSLLLNVDPSNIETVLATSSYLQLDTSVEDQDD